MGDGGRDGMERSALDKSLREMVEAAADLPVPQHLINFIDALEDEAGAEDGERKAG